jgi:hypothetical protein
VAQPMDQSGGIDVGALGSLLDDEITGRSVSGLPGRRTDWNTGAGAGASPRLANRRVAITAGISTSWALLPLPTIESCASPLPRSAAPSAALFGLSLTQI